MSTTDKTMAVRWSRSQMFPKFPLSSSVLFLLSTRFLQEVSFTDNRPGLRKAACCCSHTSPLVDCVCVLYVSTPGDDVLIFVNFRLEATVSQSPVVKGTNKRTLLPECARTHTHSRTHARACTHAHAEDKIQVLPIQAPTSSWAVGFSPVFVLFVHSELPALAIKRSAAAGNTG